MKIPPLRRSGMYAAYNADFELMFSDNTLGRGAAEATGLLVSASAISFSGGSEQPCVAQEKVFEKQAAIQGLLALGLVLYRLSVNAKSLRSVGGLRQTVAAAAACARK
jgi:hypothetical protein